MSPTVQTQTMQLPPGWHIEPRHGAQPRADELPELRDEAGHVIAVVERWQPDDPN